MVISIYRSPNSDERNNAGLLQLMPENDMNVQYKVLLGDFNLPNISWSSYTTESSHMDYNSQFIEKVRDCFFTQHILDITRIRGDNTGNTLDLIFTNDETIIGEISVESPLGKSDHASILFTCDTQEQMDNSKQQIYMYEKADYQLMKERLGIDWNQYLQDLGTEEMWKKFTNKLHEVIEECVPRKHIRAVNKNSTRKNENLPMTRKLRANIKRKQRLWEKLKKIKQENDVTLNRKYQDTEREYRRVNNQVRRQTRNAVKSKEREIARYVKENPKVFWKYVTSKTRTKAHIGELYKNEEKTQKASSDKEKADILSEQFSKVFIHESDEDPPRAATREATILDSMVITVDKIRNALQKLKKNKSPGPDGIHPTVIKELMEDLLEPLRIIYNSSLREGVVPEDWRIAHITAIYKKGNKCDPGHYRPVSLTSVLCKVMESLLWEEVIRHMKENKLFSEKQFGFISGRSTTLQLIKVLDDWTEAIDEGLAVDVV
ncbi:uncharacterized protein LOC143024116 [Oratosquilla oratoria]|uniref:uncharacterized protein LOC143024116 n=1 Tax=Oratosquilla oratoria TaxID=337810 RepID=UPI003F76899C